MRLSNNNHMTTRNNTGFHSRPNKTSKHVEMFNEPLHYLNMHGHEPGTKHDSYMDEEYSIKTPCYTFPEMIEEMWFSH